MGLWASQLIVLAQAAVATTEPEKSDFAKSAQSIGEQFALVMAAPIPFIVIMMPFVIAIWWFVNAQYSARLDSSTARLEMKSELLSLREAKLADYKEKLDGASPDAAKARIDALDRRLQDIEENQAIAPRRLNRREMSEFASIVSKHRGSKVFIDVDATSIDAIHLQKDIDACFASAGWNVSGVHSYGRTDYAKCGTAVLVADTQRLTDQQKVICDALDAVGIAYELRGPPFKIEPHTDGGSVADILLSAHEVQVEF